MSKVLIVDDDITSLELAALILERDGHDVSRFESGASAIKAVLNVNFDLLITDLMMPDVDGFSLIQAARRSQPEIKILVVSGITERVPTDMTDIALQKLSVNGFVTKPFRPRQLQSAVRDVIGMPGEKTAP